MIAWLRRLFRREPPPATIVGRYAPGTVVWGPVAFTDGSGVKDRPVLVVGLHSPGVLLVLSLSSQAKRDGRADWYALGTGTWDRERRVSWARLDPYQVMQERHVRRVGGRVDPAVFRGVVAALTTRHGRPPDGLAPTGP